MLYLYSEEEVLVWADLSFSNRETDLLQAGLWKSVMAPLVDWTVLNMAL